jgi:16S rRNA U516 pseudouridylate synthase RsuA-like enzyme
VLVNGVAAQLDTRVNPGDAVLLDNKPLRVTIPVAVVVHKPAGEPVSVPHPAELVLVKPLKRREAGIELMLSDPALARRIGDPRFPVDERWAHAGLRTRFAGIELGTLAPGEWRPLNRKEQQRLRRGVRLPPRP